MELGTLAPIAGGLLAGALGKKLGKSKDVGGDLDFQKLLAPVLAAAARPRRSPSLSLQS